MIKWLAAFLLVSSSAWAQQPPQNAADTVASYIGHLVIENAQLKAELNNLQNKLAAEQKKQEEDKK